MYALKVKKLAIIAHLPTSGVTLLVIRKLTSLIGGWLRWARRACALRGHVLCKEKFV